VQSTISLLLLNNNYGSIFIQNESRGQDLRTILILVPMYIVTLIYSIKGSFRGQLILLGLIYFICYTNMHILFGIDYDKLFLVYVLVFVVSIAALIYGFLMIDYKKIGESYFSRKTIVVVNLLLVLFSLILCLMYISQYSIFIFTGKILPLYSVKGSFEHLIPKLNLSMIAAPSILGAFWVFKKKPMGFVISMIISVLGFQLYFVVIFAAIFQSPDLVGAWDLVPLWTVLFLYSIYAIVTMFNNIDKNK
jgi:hypothetical protein